MIIFNGCKLDRSIKYDETLNLYWDREDLTNVFCMRSLGNVISVKNIRNSVIELYTLTDMWTSKMTTLDVETAKIESNGLTIAEDFISFIVGGVDKQKHNEYIVYLNFKMKYNWTSNFRTFINHNDINNNTYENNSLCAFILEKMIIDVPERLRKFSSSSTDVVELPFVKGDFLYVVYKLECLGKVRNYLIKINII